MSSVDLSAKKICPICRKEKYLVKHHITYDPEYTVEICCSCHGKAHTQISKWDMPPTQIRPREAIDLPENLSIRLLDFKALNNFKLHCLRSYGFWPIFNRNRLVSLHQCTRYISNSELVDVLIELAEKYPLSFDETSQYEVV